MQKSLSAGIVFLLGAIVVCVGLSLIYRPLGVIGFGGLLEERSRHSSFNGDHRCAQRIRRLVERARGLDVVDPASAAQRRLSPHREVPLSLLWEERNVSLADTG